MYSEHTETHICMLKEGHLYHLLTFWTITAHNQDEVLSYNMGSGESTVVISKQPLSHAKHDLTVCHVYNHCILKWHMCMYVCTMFMAAYVLSLLCLLSHEKSKKLNMVGRNCINITNCIPASAVCTQDNSVLQQCHLLEDTGMNPFVITLSCWTGWCINEDRKTPI